MEENNNDSNRTELAAAISLWQQDLEELAVFSGVNNPKDDSGKLSNLLKKLGAHLHNALELTTRPASGIDAQKLEQALAKLAFNMTEVNLTVEPSEERVNNWLTYLREVSTTTQTLADVEIRHITVGWGALMKLGHLKRASVFIKTEQGYQFFNPLLQDYFTALCLTWQESFKADLASRVTEPRFARARLFAALVEEA